MGPELISAYATATEEAFWPLVSAHLTAASPYMLATHERNLDVDCRDIRVLQHAPKTTDPVESQFAIYDYVLRLGAGFGSTAGVAQSISMKTMATPGEMGARAKRAVDNKRAKGIGLDMPIAKQVANQLAVWNTMSFFALPMERRWVIIKSVRMAYKETAKAELVLLRKMDEAKAARLKAAREEEIAKFANRSLKYAKFDAMVVIASTAMLLALVARHDGSPKELVDALLDQIRIRRHVYGVPAADLPCMGAKSGTTAASEAGRLRQAFETMVEKPLPAKPPPPTPYPLRAAAAAPSVLAVQLDVSHVSAVSHAWRELVAVLNGAAVFNAPKKKKKRKKVGLVAGPAAKKAKTGKSKAPAAKAPTPVELALAGEEFEEDGVDWRVHSVRWHPGSNAVVVWYYDIVEADRAAVSESNMDKAIECGDSYSYDCLEYSSVPEIKEWLKASRH